MSRKLDIILDFKLLNRVPHHHSSANFPACLMAYLRKSRFSLANFIWGFQKCLAVLLSTLLSYRDPTKCLFVAHNEMRVLIKPKYA